MERKFNEKDPIDHLRAMVNVFSYCNETFNQRYSIDELFAIYKAHVLAEWDFLPDSWTDRQLKEAIKSIVPRWNDNEKPIYK